MTAETIARANASIRRGRRIVLAFIVPGTCVLLAAFLSRGFNRFQLADLFDHSLLTWTGIAFVALVCAWGIRESLRSTRMRLSLNGIEGLNRGHPLLWADITRADYAGSWLELRDRHGRRVKLSLMFGAHDVLEAVQDHLPQGVRLRVY